MVSMIKLRNGYRAMYTTERYVIANGSVLSKAKILCGVLQGPILGPLLFLICTNDLPAVSSTLLPILFTDNINSIVTNKNFTSLISEVHSGVEQFFQLNNL